MRTAFHEFGHALHGMFSNVKYPRFSGTSVPRDFVEYPSQVNEMWATWPEILKNYAKHYKTGEPMPQALLDKVQAAEKFNQGFKTTEYLAATLLDQAWHQLKPDRGSERRAGFRSGSIEESRRRFSAGAAALSQLLFLAHFFRRLLGRLLLVSLERSAGCRHGGVVQSNTAD